MKEWFDGLESRERITLLAGAAVLAVALVWVLLINPLYLSAGDRAKKVEALRSDLVRAQQLRAEIASLRQQGNTVSGANAGNQSLLIILENTARESGLRAKQSRPMDKTTVRVQFEQAPFESLVSWMGVLANRYGVQIEIASLDRQDTPGLVDAQLTLTRPTA